MASKLPWATAAVIIVVAVGLGAWILLTSEVAPAGYGTVTVGSTNVVFTGDIPTYSGIENIYIMDTGQYTKTNNLGEITTGRMGVIQSSGGSVNIPYENTFDIVVAIKIKAPENAAYAAKENGQVELTVSGLFSIGPENSANDNEYIFASQNPGTTNGWVRVNVVWDNNGSGYTLPAGGSISLNPVKLWCWF